MCLAEAKSCSLTLMLIHEATQTGKCWDEIKGILRLKVCNANIHTYTLCLMEIQQEDNETLTTYIHPQQLSDMLLTMTLQQSPSLLKALEMHPPSQLRYEKNPQILAEVIRLVENISAAHQLTGTLTLSTVSMMSGNDRCFACGCTGHFGHHCPDVQCYGCDEFGHFAQDCRKAMPPRQILFKASIHPQLKGHITLLLWSQT